MIRTDRDTSGIGHDSLTVVEVVSTVRLRSALGLRDGSRALPILRWLQKSATIGGGAVTAF